MVDQRDYGASVSAQRFFVCFLTGLVSPDTNSNAAATTFFERIHVGFKSYTDDTDTFVYKDEGVYNECVVESGLPEWSTVGIREDKRGSDDWKSEHMQVCGANCIQWPVDVESQGQGKFRFDGMTLREAEAAYILDKLWPAPLASYGETKVSFADISKGLGAVTYGLISEDTRQPLDPDAGVGEQSPWKPYSVAGAKVAVRITTEDSQVVRLLHPLEEFRMLGWCEGTLE